MEPEKIMVVDDNREFLEELEEILSLTGYKLRVVNDSTAALDCALKYKPDIILLDLRMQKMNGFEVAEQLKINPQTSSIPIIAMSGYFPLEKKSTLIDTNNMKTYLKKPFSVIDLLEQIEATLKGQPRRLPDSDFGKEQER